MSAERENEAGVHPFRSLTHEMVYGGPGPQEHDFDMHEGDVTLFVEAANHTVRLLHLKNVRTDTVAAAKSAVDDFLEQLEPDSDNPRRIERTVFKNFDEVRQHLRHYVSAAQVEVEELEDQLKMVNHYPRRVTKTTPKDLGLPEDNPVATVQAACKEFLKQLKLVDDSKEPRKRGAHAMSKVGCDSHGKVYDYMVAEAEKRNLIFEWYDSSYNRPPKYGVRFLENGHLDTYFGSK